MDIGIKQNASLSICLCWMPQEAKHCTELCNENVLILEVHCVLILFFIFPSVKYSFYFAAFKNKVLEVTVFLSF